MKDFFSNPKEDEYLSEFKQKVAQEMQENIQQRERDLERSRNGFIGSVAGIVLAFLVSWFILLPHFRFDQNKEIPIIRRPILPVKIQPSEPGGMDIPDKDKMVYSLVEKNEINDTKVESLLPSPEMPQMPVIAADPVIETLDESFSDPSQKEQISDVKTTATEQIKVPAKLAVIDVNVVTTNEPLTVKEKPEDKIVEETKEEKTELLPEPQKEIETPKVVEEPQKEVEKKISEAPKEILQKEVSHEVLNGLWTVQMMASTQKDSVEKGYQTLLKQYEILQKLPHVIEEGKDGLNRLKIGDFKTKEEAENLCAQIKNKGGNCLVKQR